MEAPWDAEGVPLSGYAIMSRVGPLAFIICFVLLEISGCFEFSVVKWLALLVSWKLEFWRGAYHDAHIFLRFLPKSAPPLPFNIPVPSSRNVLLFCTPYAFLFFSLTILAHMCLPVSRIMYFVM